MKARYFAGIRRVWHRFKMRHWRWLAGHDMPLAQGFCHRFHKAKVAAKRFSVNLAPLRRYAESELEQLRQLVTGARARLADLEVNSTKESSRVDVMQAVLFRQRREHDQKGDPDAPRLIVD